MSVLREIAVFLCGFILMRQSYAQVVLPGPCPDDVQAMKDFEPSRYLGKWYEIQRYFFVFEFGGKCVIAKYGSKEDGGITVINKQISTFTGKPSQIKGVAEQVGDKNEGKLSVTFPSVPVPTAAPYWIVDTDYDSYAVVWSCNSFGLFHTVNSWILTRERNPSPAVLEKAYAAVDENNISRKYYQKTDQSNCPEQEKEPNTN